MMHSFGFSNGLFVLLLLFTGCIKADGVREHTRIDYGARISVSQVEDLTLIVAKAETRNLQTWIRTAATIDFSDNKLTAKICTENASLIKIGQRIRAFPPASKSSIYQSRVMSISKDNGCVIADTILPGTVYGKEQRYVMEIIALRGNYLSVPNEAIIEETSHQLVYVQQHPGHYVPKIIQTGIKGELYSEVVQGLEVGDDVVTFGSFFIDADYKLNISKQSGTGHAHHHH